MASANPIADEVTVDDFGAQCSRCWGVVYVDKVVIKSKKAIFRYRHVFRNPPCLSKENPIDYSKMLGHNT